MRTTRLSVLIALVAMGAIVRGRTEPDRVDVQSWQTPQTGWIYVLDASTAESRIFLFDPKHGEVTGTIRTGDNPDIAVSPRGDRLYVASVVEGCGQPDCDQLAVIDTQAGRVLSTTSIHDRVHYKVSPESSRMAVSSDGRTVYVLTWLGLPSGDTPVGLAAFDPVRGRFLDGVIDLGRCGFGTFVPATDRNRIEFHCPDSNEVMVYRLTAPDRASLASSVRLPWGQRLFAGHVYPDVSARAFMLSTDHRRLFVTGGDGAISEVTLTTGGVEDTSVTGNQNEAVVPVVSSGALERFYVGVGPYDGQGVARAIRVLDTSTWARVGTMQTSTPFRTAVVTQDGSAIYVLTEDGKVLAIDPLAQRELRAMPVGRAPSLALIAP